VLSQLKRLFADRDVEAGLYCSNPLGCGRTYRGAGVYAPHALR
jgi:hypothetical protein